MDQIIFIGITAVLIFLTIAWGGKILPREKWQILATLPLEKDENGRWRGLNLTYYGLFSANAYTFAVVIFLLLTVSAGIPVQGICIFILALLGVCMPAAKIIAKIVEKKSGTLTVGGAVFAGSLVAPWLIFLINLIPGLVPGRTDGFNLNVTVILSAMCIAYAYGEGLGRLACISFGCCYGKPVDQCRPWVQKLFGHFYLVFFGKTKKIAYASGLEGEKVIPIQIITAILYSTAALVGTWLYMNGYFAAALMETMVVTQVWRILSEFFRADFRGCFKITPYQVMAAGSLAYILVVLLFFSPARETLVHIEAGFRELRSPWVMIFVEVIWVLTFLYTGRSSVTGAQILFHVEKGKI
ncbi:hypothetical protein HRM2_01910 [Desulforapulum autotrophicum HRM2]|uniref:Prolipoprotein diacylglyceryl transferase n=1 Tax=Desulforapulum autotrophicum (strain ATCC 43914 / DSM 3382 / VKM B-1955 / HRM2) TaxID=177437 RepID=C0QFB7_DESAH|nr:hypothetical protein [Desulforapulum autotrophicum]ACN13313.1 hypothetical protein HRM2_01910 [Desulforapulum autotrophicum HRM2]